MPTIAFFYGIAIRMYFRDHPPPHFVAKYGGAEANVAIATGEIIAGSLPANAERLVRLWSLEYRDALMDNWDRARANLPLQRIPGLDQ